MTDPIDRLALLNVQDNVVPTLKALERSFDRPNTSRSPVVVDAQALLRAAIIGLEYILRESPFRRTAVNLPEGRPLDPPR